MSRVAVVTGAARGLGRAIADRFVVDGYRVAFADVDAAGAREAAAPHGDTVLRSSSTSARSSPSKPASGRRSSGSAASTSG